jgi:hypothetical protein
LVIFLIQIKVGHEVTGSPIANPAFKTKAKKMRFLGNAAKDAP